MCPHVCIKNIFHFLNMSLLGLSSGFFSLYKHTFALNHQSVSISFILSILLEKKWLSNLSSYQISSLTCRCLYWTLDFIAGIGCSRFKLKTKLLTLTTISPYVFLISVNQSNIYSVLVILGKFLKILKGTKTITI